jgi:UDP-2,3-diacylglucosamine pyrophosphatase LpxH
MAGDHHIGEGDDRYVVALSDVHLGTDGPTVWYQRAVHEAPLRHLLRWVVDHADQVREVVLLGDIVDLWTYPAVEAPPTFADIVACHPEILGPDGALAQVLDALDGAVSYVPGNHDLGVTAADVGLIASRSGHRVRLVDHVPYFPLGDDRRIALAHGHHFTLFNAPHLHNDRAPTPVGYYVTRAVATSWARRLEEGRTVADLPGQGAPNGLDLGSLGAVALGISARSITASVVDFVAGATGVALDEAITMPDGGTTTLADVRLAYADCWTDWVQDHGGGMVGTASAIRAALADFDGSYLGWFAQKLAFEHDADLVVMGHTHVPISGLDGSLVRYVNTGFDCPSGPDMALAANAQRITFAVIDTVEADAAVWEVASVPADGDADPDLVCRPAEAARTRVVQGQGMDFSTYVVIDNTHGDEPLELVDAEASYGYFPVEPPPIVPAGGRARIWIQDLLGVSGSTGTATYRAGDRTFALHFGCPTLGTNMASGTPELRSRAGTGRWRHGVARWGHPFFVEFTI